MTDDGHRVMTIAHPEGMDSLGTRGLIGRIYVWDH